MCVGRIANVDGDCEGEDATAKGRGVIAKQRLRRCDCEGATAKVRLDCEGATANKMLRTPQGYADAVIQLKEG